MILLAFLLSYTIADIDIRAGRVDPNLILETSGINIGEELRPADIQRIVQNLSRLHLFNHIAIDTSIIGDGVFVTIRVEEAPFLKSPPKFIGNSKVKSKDLAKKTELRAGQVLTNRHIFDACHAILAHYEEKTFYGTEVADSVIAATDNQVELIFNITEGTKPRIGEINIEGNVSFTDNRIRKLMENKPKGFLRSGKLDREKLTLDLLKIEAFYKENGYLEVSIDEPRIEVVNERFIITVAITENRQYYAGTVAFEGNEVFGTERLEGLMTYEPGTVYNLTAVQETDMNFGAAYGDEGYIYCNIIRDEMVRDDSIIDILYKVKESEPANINRVIITGNYSTREKVIRREIVSLPGDRFRRSNIIRSAREIFNLGFFDNVEPNYGTPDEAGNIDLIYHVTEKEGVATVGAGVAYSAQDRLTGYFELSHPNVFGRGQRLYTKFEIGGRLTNIQLGFTEPWLFDRRISAGGDLYYTNRFWDFYTKRDIGIAGRLTLPFYLDYSQLAYTLRIERTEIFDIASSYSPPETGYSLYDDTIPKWTLSNSFAVVRDSRDFIFNPSSGTYISLRAEIAKKFLFANVDYNRFTLEARTYYPVFWKFVLMLRTKTGIVTSVDDVPLYKRFYAGGIGDDGVRGYADRSLSPVEDGRRIGGNAIFVNNIELKLKLSQSLAFLLFYDVGNTFKTYRDVNLHGLYRGAGAGVRIEVPMMGVLGFDLGYGFDSVSPGFEPHFQINPFGMF